MLKLYLNGQLVASGYLYGSIATGATDHNIAFAGGDVHFNGQIDEVRIWNVALSQADIDKLRFQRLTGSEPALAGYWRFDDASGSTAADSSPYGRSGTLIGSPPWVFSGAPIGWPHARTIAATLGKK